MGNVEAKQDALFVVLDAAQIHSKSLTDSLSEEKRFGSNPSFYSARRSYIRKLDGAIREAQAIRFNEEASVMQRVRDLNLEEATALRFAVEDHIRTLVGRSNLA